MSAGVLKFGCMTHNKYLIEYFETYLPLTEEEKGLISAKSELRTVKRKETVLQAGDFCKHYLFVIEGCLKMYAMDANGRKHNLQFAAENEWIADIGSFHSGKPSQMFIEVIEPSTIISIEKQNLYSLYTAIPKLDRIFKVIIENKYVELQNRLLQTISSSAQERYLAFIEQYPKMVLRLPSTQIASYLGITPEFLSQIRKDISIR